MQNRFRFRFEATCRNSEAGDLFIYGDDEALGNWDIERAKLMKRVKPNTWAYSDVILPTSFHYKFFFKSKRGDLHMEECEDRVVDVAESCQSKHGEVTEISLVNRFSEASQLEVHVSRKRWWKEAIVYQIYPRSFCDSNGDGVGDLRGIISKLDYLKELGVGVIWLSPVYQSPNDDNGYDISDYQAISSEFGTMHDWEELVHQIHKREMKLVMDLVVNHTSDEHHWFTESRKSKDNKYRDYYIWKKGKDGRPPNNWSSFFGGSVWEYDPRTEEYYLHLFSKKQPDLNWENPKVRQEIHEMMHFWLRKGVDGFRMDVINVISKVPHYPDAIEKAEGSYHWGGDFFVNGPRLMEFLQGMKNEVLCKYDILSVGETPFFGIDDACRMTNEGRGVVNMLFHFELMDVDTKPERQKWEWQPWRLEDIKAVMSGWQIELQGKGWNSLYLENHDQPRSVSRFGNDTKYRAESAKMLATWLHMMQGTAYIYQGQEIGMTNANFSSINDYRDIETINAYEQLMTRFDEETVMTGIRKKSRDNARTPFQWNAKANAGFSTGTPWIKVNQNYPEINVEKQKGDPDSVLQHYKRLIELRKLHPVVVYGSFEAVMEDHPTIYAYIRTFYNERLLVLANFSDMESTFAPPQLSYNSATLLIGNYSTEEGLPAVSFQFRPFEARVYLMKI